MFGLAKNAGQMKLTKGEFCQFNLKSRITLVENNGFLIVKRKIDETHEIRLFQMGDFQVEVFCDFKMNKILKIDPILHTNWIDLYAEERQ